MDYRYRWEFDSPVNWQVHGLTDDALLALVVVLEALVEDPWGFGRAVGEVVDPVRNMRELPFGGHGLMRVTINEPHPMLNDPEALVLVTEIIWSG